MTYLHPIIPKRRIFSFFCGYNRSNTASHRRAIEERGYGDIATVDIMDGDGYIDIPVADTKYLKYDRVGSHLANYGFMINLAHFKGHAMGGLGTGTGAEGRTSGAVSFWEKHIHK